MAGGFFARIKQGMQKTRQTLTYGIDQLFGVYKELDDDFYEELEMTLISADMGVETTEKLVLGLKACVRERRLTKPDEVKAALRELVQEHMQGEVPDFPSPTVLLIVGVNGVGKTTTIGKLASRFKQQGKSVLIVAADTFRAAAVEQLSIWANRADVPIVKHEQGADPAAVAFDAMSAAKSRKVDITIVDTAGRLHNKANLMSELNKIQRVIEREHPGANLLVYLVMDSTTGQNGLLQAKAFSEVVRLNGIVLTKLDGTAKGGIAMAIKSELGLSPAFIGVGEGMEDMQPFDAAEYAEAIL